LVFWHEYDMFYRSHSKKTAIEERCVDVLLAEPIVVRSSIVLVVVGLIEMIAVVVDVVIFDAVCRFLQLTKVTPRIMVYATFYIHLAARCMHISYTAQHHVAILLEPICTI